LTTTFLKKKSPVLLTSCPLHCWNFIFIKIKQRWAK